ncbi:uncharacterized protein LOC100275640 precursor [Zea mays]|uniref:Uncharacterized protein n=1 Tax=Zea mays TaxID=4577 RepID=B6SX29_MAIZE|nr:uncharacterized protein LOC100275640 precursor [Zea mays]ACG29412.1 hypothetical protein [Zea mays]ONM31382.1 hypothetical protein ZEAMMB73_Zm00001d040450 [Zea mays]ONM31383.1 hypothetical protein ZEAMMB73_Zm00001d040450 [Zea mays]|eukprot:NP_001152908.1 uncharacterized protein LOC100275640 precursor [Zea mays]
MATIRKHVSVPAILLALAVLSCLLLVSAAGNRRALLPREPADTYAGGGRGQVVLPTTTTAAEEGAAVLGAELAEAERDETMVVDTAARRAGLLQTQDYPGSGPNGRHDPRNPH